MGQLKFFIAESNKRIYALFLQSSQLIFGEFVVFDKMNVYKVIHF